MIEVFASRFPDAAKEQYQLSGKTTVLQWLYDHGIEADRDLQSLPISVHVNGIHQLPCAWEKLEISPCDYVEIYREPKGTDPFSITFALIFGAKAALAALMPKLPTQSSAGGGRSGEGLDEANAKGNKVKLNSIRTEIFGRNPQRYPDFATPGRRYFAAPREQRVELCLFVGVGYYEIPVSRVKVGETPLTTLGDDARFALYEPGQSLAADAAHYNWYPAPEVGPSSSGSPGLELTVSTTLTESVTATAMTFDAKTVAIAVGAGSFPADWTPGLLIRIAAPYNYTVVDGGSAGRDVINGDIAALGFPNGATIEIAGVNAGTYVVHAQTATTLELDYLGGVPATGLVLGDVVMAFGYPGLRFKITAISAQLMSVDRLLEDGSVDGVWTGWSLRTTSQGQIRLDTSNYTGGYRGAFPACPENEVVDMIEWSLLYTTLIGIGREGQEYAISSGHVFEYRDMAVGGAWTTLTKSVSGNSMDVVGFTFREILPYPMRPECRIRRLPPQGSSGRNDEAQDDSQWYSLYGRMFTQSPTSYEGMTMLTADIRGGDRLSTRAENLISLECTRKLPVLRNGMWLPMQPTREISATIGYICRDSGYSDTEDLDIATLERLERTRWTPRGEYYDKIVTDQDTVKGYLIEALIPGMSELTIDRGVITAVRDEPRGETFDHVYNPRVMLAPLSRNFTGPQLPDQFDGVDVEYYDHLTKQDEVVECRLQIAPGVYEPGVKVKKERLEGVGDRTRAWRYGMRVRRSFLYRQGSYEFETELAGLNSSYFSYAGLGDSTPSYGQNAEIIGYVAGTPVTLVSSIALDWSQGGVYKVLVRRRDGSASGPYTATRIDDRTFTIPSLDFEPVLNTAAQPPIIQFGHESRWVYPALITEVNPKGTRTCSMKAVNYDVRMYADDNNFPPAGA
jgi:hypothetical protein